MERTELDSLATSLLDRVERSGARRGETPDPPGTLLLEVLAKSLGADQVLWAPRGPGTEDGMVEVVDDRILVRIRGGKARQRERFTLAHEIGHLVLAQPDLRLMSMRRRSGLEDAERFCDAFAAALLMPREWIEREYKKRPQTLEMLLECSGRSQTSLSATLLRLRGSLGWSASLLHWRHAAGQWRMIGLTGVPYRLRRELTSTGETQQLLKELPAGRLVTDLPLELPSGGIRVRAEALVRPRSIVGLVDLKGVGREPWRRPKTRVDRPAGSWV